MQKNIQAFSEESLLLGETAMPHAPKVRLRNGRNCTPQQFLQYSHNFKSVSQIIADIDYDERFPLLLSEENGGIVLQVAIIGPDNYGKCKDPKIVYGRKWRIEPELPSSEIIQTAFLAIKKAREHEIRELFILENNGQRSTPFSGHQDLPLMAKNTGLFTSSSDKLSNIEMVQTVLDKLRFDGQTFKLWDMQTVFNELTVLYLRYGQDDIYINVQALTENSLVYALMEKLIQQSNHEVDENFKYRGFARFSHNNSIKAIGQLSVDVRRVPITEEFDSVFTDTNYATDSSRVPKLGNDLAAQKAKRQIKNNLPLLGILPNLD